MRRSRPIKGKIFLSVIIGLFLVVSVLNLKEKALAIEGCFCGPSSSCYPDGCTRKTIKDDGTVDYNLCKEGGCGGAYDACYNTDSIEVNRYFCLEQPPCCEEMAKRDNLEVCCWPEKGYCHPVYCNQLTDKGSCGYYWRWNENAKDLYKRPYGYGCLRGTSPDNLEPVYGLPEIAKKTPTSIPTSTPTPTKLPTLTSTPTEALTPTPTPPPVISFFSPTPTFFIFPSPTTFPQRSPPFLKIEKKSELMGKIKNNSLKLFLATKIAAKKIALPPKKAFLEIKRIDRKIEDFVNEKISLLVLKIFNFMKF